MDPHPVCLLEKTRSLRSPSIPQSSPKPRFRIRTNCPLNAPPKPVIKTVNNFIKIVDGPTQMSRTRTRPRFLPKRASDTDGRAYCSDSSISGGGVAGECGPVTSMAEIEHEVEVDLWGRS